MRDACFDIRNYDRIRKELFGLPENAGIEEERSLFRAFLASAHEYGIRVIFDIAMNHTSNTNPWFIEASKGEGSPYDDFFIWNEDTNKYKETRLLFKGMCPSNWEKEGDRYYFHRFFEFQPDLNYHNPQVLLTMGRILLFWLSQGVDGFRADAIPYIWKTEGTDCENLPEAHLIIRFWRAMLDFMKPGTLLLAEACQPPKEVVKYFGEENECHAGYHFPLMPQLFIALGQGKAEPIINILSEEITPKIPQSCQWFTFLRCHDELTLEMVTPEERNIMNGLYRHQDRWNFREGEGIAARLSELMKFDHRKVLLAYSMMLTLPGTPVIYYGDEYGKSNDEAYYNQQVSATGYTDSRYYVRGPVDWNEVEAAMAAPDSFGGIVFYGLKQMLHERRQSGAFSRGNLTFKTLMNEKGQECTSVLGFEREFEQDRILVIHNLSGKKQTLDLSDYNFKASVGLLTNLPLSDGYLLLEPYSYHWVRL
jgi:maltose alpha-D-glucosyltransferase/alpha-amylase